MMTNHKKRFEDKTNAEIKLIRSNPISGGCKAQSRSLLLSRDFIVTSSVHDNLLISIALQKDRKDCIFEGYQEDKHRVVLVGVFKAICPISKFSLGHHATRVATEANAGGSSVISEALSVEYFVRRFGVTNVVTEMEVEYQNSNWKKVDYLCDFHGHRVGVSVTRAMSYPNPKDFSREKAKALLQKKLHGLVVARSGVSQKHSFSKAILHVWCETTKAAKILRDEFKAIAKDYNVEEDLVMILTVAEGRTGRPIFYESKCKALGSSKISRNDPQLWRIRKRLH